MGFKQGQNHSFVFSGQWFSWSNFNPASGPAGSSPWMPVLK
jgi:hypothetical protein